MVRKFAIVLGVAAAFLAASVFAADANAPKPKKPETVRLEGTVSVTKDSNDVNVVTSIKLTTAKKTVYYVTLDKKGKELGDFNGKEVEVQCVITEKKDGQKWITVHEFRLVEKKKETPLTKPRGTKK
jgi:lipoprotein-anchoring transpeptidase ErfK/SrfK